MRRALRRRHTGSSRAWGSRTSPTSCDRTPPTSPTAPRSCSATAGRPGPSCTSGRAGSPPGSPPPASGRRTASRSSTRTASSTSRCSSAPRSPTPSASTSTGASRRRRSSSSSTTPQAKVFVVGPDFVPVLDAIADALTTVGTILVIGGHATYQDYDEWVAEHDAGRPAHAERTRRRRVPALLERHDRPAEGRDAVERQLLRPAARGDGHVGARRRLREPRRDAAVPHRRRRLGGGRACTRAPAASSCASSTRRRSCG